MLLVHLKRKHIVVLPPGQHVVTFLENPCGDVCDVLDGILGGGLRGLRLLAHGLKSLLEQLIDGAVCEGGQLGLEELLEARRERLLRPLLVPSPDREEPDVEFDGLQGKGRHAREQIRVLLVAHPLLLVRVERRMHRLLSVHPELCVFKSPHDVVPDTEVPVHVPLPHDAPMRHHRLERPVEPVLRRQQRVSLPSPQEMPHAKRAHCLPQILAHRLRGVQARCLRLRNHLAEPRHSEIQLLHGLLFFVPDPAHPGSVRHRNAVQHREPPRPGPPEVRNVIPDCAQRPVAVGERLQGPLAYALQVLVPLLDLALLLLLKQPLIHQLLEDNPRDGGHPHPGVCVLPLERHKEVNLDRLKGLAPPEHAGLQPVAVPPAHHLLAEAPDAHRVPAEGANHAVLGAARLGADVARMEAVPEVDERVCRPLGVGLEHVEQRIDQVLNLANLLGGTVHVVNQVKYLLVLLAERRGRLPPGAPVLLALAMALQ
mmetsp:Transcript_37207/g.91593  ORF Transcript_37207/g.91593 Transcript_37207/m.91593 type:complete len:484 (+) Transcript_37207:56-1507(+)